MVSAKRSPLMPLSRKKRIAFSITSKASSLEVKILLRERPLILFCPSGRRCRSCSRRCRLRWCGTGIFLRSVRSGGRCLCRSGFFHPLLLLLCLDRRLQWHIFAAFTDIGVHLGDSLADDADIVQVWLDTVVWAAAYCNLKFVGKGNIPVAFVEALVDFLSEMA